MKRYTVTYHRAQDDEGLPGDVYQVVGVYYAPSASAALAQCPYRTTEEGEYLRATPLRGAAAC